MLHCKVSPLPHHGRSECDACLSEITSSLTLYAACDDWAGIYVTSDGTMQKPILAIATLLITFSPIALAKDLPSAGIVMAQERDVPTATLEIVEQQKSIKLACQTFQFDVRPPTTDGDNLESTLSCFTAVDANTPLLWEYVNKKQRLEKAVLSVTPGKGPSYMVEVPNVMIVTISFTDNYSSKVSINLAAASSRLTVRPAPQ